MSDKPERAILVSFAQPFSVMAAEMLAAEHGWEIAYWIAGEKIEAAVSDRLTETVFHGSGDARRGVWPKGAERFEPVALDAEILSRHLDTEREVLTQCDRLNSVEGSFTVHERMELFYDQLSYWLGVLRAIRPTVVVFMTTPHIIYDQIIYDICKLEGIRVVIFEKTNIAGWIFSHDDFRLAPAAMLADYRNLLAGSNGDGVELHPRLEEAFVTGGGDYKQAMPVSLRNAMAKSGVAAQPGPVKSADSGFKKTVAELRARAGMFFERLALSRIPVAVTKIDGRPVSATEMTRWEFLKARYRIRRAKKLLTDTYRSLCKPVDFSAPYIYVTLQYQPEQSTNPQGGAFQHQYLMVELLASLLPAGWKLYVREHVAALLSHSHFERGRRPEYYHRLAAMPSVVLVAPEVNSFALIDNAKAVATVSGSIGWEAVLRRKPALLFGYGWYRGCEGIFDAQTTHDLAQALARIADGYEIDLAKVRLYLKALEKNGFEGYNLPSWGDASGISPEQNARAFVDELLRVVNSVNAAQ